MPYVPGLLVKSKVLARRTLENPEYCELDLRSPEVVRKATPGQFVHIRLPEADPAMLRRPFSIAGCDGETLTLLFKKVGKLTYVMAGMKPGDTMDVLGPLGTGYQFDGTTVKNAVLIGGGYGVAPLLLLAKYLRDRRLAERISLLVGARTADQLLWRDRLAKEPWLNSQFATEDGAVGLHGTVIDLCASLLSGIAGSVRLYGCGPMGMLATLSKRWKHLPVQVAVENQMGCGVGVCLGCVLPVHGAEGHGRFVRICCDGPVFDGRTIDWTACPLSL